MIPPDAILSLDVSSTAIGYAWMSAGHPRPKVHDCGVLWPNKKSEPSPLERAHGMCDELQKMLDEQDQPPSLVLIEAPPQAQRGRKMNPSAQHQAFGMVWRVVREAKVPTIVCVNPNTVARGVKKVLRNRYTREEYRLPADKDPGGDAADAVHNGKWWFEEGQYRQRSA